VSELDGTIFMSKVEDPTNWDLDGVTLPEFIVDMIPERDGVLICGDAGGIWMFTVSDDGSPHVKYVGHKYAFADSPTGQISQLNDDDPKPDHVIVEFHGTTNEKPQGVDRAAFFSDRDE